MTEQSRRAFLKRAACFSLAGGASPFVMNLAAIGEAAAATASDYKALVCIFLFGGNDYANTVDALRSAELRSLRAAARHDRAQPGLALADHPLSEHGVFPAAANMRWRRTSRRSSRSSMPASSRWC